ncbi:MAG: DUF4129 domain-containing protein [Burkholderiales bacterium]
MGAARRWPELLLCAAVAVLATCPAQAVEAASAPMSAEQVQRVVAEMKADPAWGGTHAERALRFKNRDSNRSQPGAAPHWAGQLVRWFAAAGRGAVWVLGALAVALLAVFAWRWASVRSEALRVRAELLPSHVNELDIRPASLPADIGAAARALCQRGEMRAALSLLYRGALSRLVHDRHVPIRAASTEGECVQLAGHVLPASAGAYFERLVAAWQTEVYAGRPADASAVAALCDGFGAHFDTTALAMASPATATA